MVALVTVTYLIISNTLELFKWNVLADGWHTEGAVSVVFFPYYVTAVGLDGFS